MKEIKETQLRWYLLGGGCGGCVAPVVRKQEGEMKGGRGLHYGQQNLLEQQRSRPLLICNPVTGTAFLITWTAVGIPFRAKLVS